MASGGGGGGGEGWRWGRRCGTRRRPGPPAPTSSTRTGRRPSAPWRLPPSPTPASLRSSPKSAQIYHHHLLCNTALNIYQGLKYCLYRAGTGANYTYLVYLKFYNTTKGRESGLYLRESGLVVSGCHCTVGWSETDEIFEK